MYIAAVADSRLDRDTQHKKDRDQIESSVGLFGQEARAKQAKSTHYRQTSAVLSPSARWALTSGHLLVEQ